MRSVLVLITVLSVSAILSEATPFFDKSSKGSLFGGGSSSGASASSSASAYSQDASSGSSAGGLSFGGLGGGLGGIESLIGYFECKVDGFPSETDANFLLSPV